MRLSCASCCLLHFAFKTGNMLVGVYTVLYHYTCKFFCLDTPSNSSLLYLLNDNN